MVKREIIKINKEKCDGCGLCIPNCPEGALQVIDNKARLISDLFCDGLGACIGHCPQGAIEIEEREAEPYEESKVMENIVKQGENTIKAHLEHLKEHGETDLLKEAEDFLKKNDIEVPDLESKDPLPCGCPGTHVKEFKAESDVSGNTEQASALTQWPVQMKLVPSHAPFLDNCHLLVAADCTAFAHPNFHSTLLHGKKLLIGCPKLDDVEQYTEKLTETFKANNIKSVTVAIMEVPCCSGLYYAVEKAVEGSGKNIPIIKEVISIDGNTR